MDPKHYFSIINLVTNPFPYYSRNMLNCYLVNVSLLAIHNSFTSNIILYENRIRFVQFIHNEMYQNNHAGRDDK